MNPKPSWKETLGIFLTPQVIRMLFLGFSAGLPILLIFSSLSVWLREAGVDRSIVTYFSWAALGYSFKFVWAPLVDSLEVPFLTAALGRRRAWLLLSQLLIVLSIVLMSMVDPADGASVLTYTALSAVLLGFSSATQDIVIDAYRIESASSKFQAMMSSAYIGGYRIGMLVAGAGALLLAGYFGSDAGNYEYSAWRNAYLFMSLFMLVGLITTMVIKEPSHAQTSTDEVRQVSRIRILMLFVLCVLAFIFTYSSVGQMLGSFYDWLNQVTHNRALSGLLTETLKLIASLIAVWIVADLLVRMQLVERQVVSILYVEPVQNFFQEHGTKSALLVLLFIGLYRLSDIVLGVIANVFYVDLGFSKTEIATVVKSFGLLMTLVGGALGGVLCMRYGVLRVLLLGAVLSALTNLLFVLLSAEGNELWLLYVVISADNLSAGLAVAAFVAFLSALTNIKFTAMQYAIFSSLMTLLPKTIGGYSGSMVNTMGYANFFTMTAIMGIPVIVLIVYLGAKTKLKIDN